ncbi:4-alpha-glucanotransferase [Chitinophagaceae bacterium LB-8]|uniref:4-alpha-glucanotransferase n=1 Tax=Paraflavisolibacter caeni TaxID=2982496 RepID=A0A9X2XY60_9BACT|nr:4-alpha-glucanotransferase [Paraflavisolibacter caeni]MCU7551576.1 4-alpha-glucanotransferase [Paraflavisolibacter caeni]
MKINFLIRFSTKFGQNLSITGNIPALGLNKLENALPMSYLNENYWQATIELKSGGQESIQYRYIFQTETGENILEGEQERILFLDKNSKIITVIDTWVYAGSYELVFHTSPYQKIFFKEFKGLSKETSGEYTHLFKVKAPLLSENECVCLLGSSQSFGNWQTERPVLLERKDKWWQVGLDFSSDQTPVSYKYGIFNIKDKKFVRWEDGGNRILNLNHPADQPVVLHDGFVRLPANTWKGAGVAIPVFSLRSQNSGGIGEFSDLKLLADWAADTGLKLIQVLPVNDTTATFTPKDSYPYSAISAFALNPVYINLQQVAGNQYAAALKAYANQLQNLNSLSEVDYEAVIELKLKVLRELFDIQTNDFTKEKEYQMFFEDNKHWLQPYAAFCVFRDQFGTSEFQKWKHSGTFNKNEVEKLSTKSSEYSNKIDFWFFVQYHLHLQLKDAVAYAHSKGIAIKGDIPIGIYRYGCDAWTAPELYNMEWQAGAPPDDFAVKGQNWGFPTYNWHRMQEDGFKWWHQRFHQMSNYFDAFRIDHILGFFRIWSIPIHAVEGILGRFVPVLPIHVSEFSNRGIDFNYNRFFKPFINQNVLKQIFGDKADYVAKEFLEQQSDGSFALKDDFNTQQKVESYFAGKEKSEYNRQLREGLFDLISNVLLFEQEGSNGQEFHFRISIMDTPSYMYLDDHVKYHIYELYVDYFYQRQDEFWKQEALRKLPALKEATNMLICGEDLGMVPHSVPEVMKDLGILSLEIQRMPKNPRTEFFHPKDAPYLSVVTPSTHDMSTIRGWWEESPEKTQRFFNIILGEHGQAPLKCEPWINRKIVLQHLNSPAMWSIFQLQDLLSNNETLLRPNPHEERINNPADPNHYWNYRMHLTLEQLLKEKEFNHDLRSYLENCGRASNKTNEVENRITA